MRTWRIRTNKHHTALSAYFSGHTTDSRCMRNTANYYIRNTMTGIQKTADERTEAEQKVLDAVFYGIKTANENAVKRILKSARRKKGMYATAELYSFLKKPEIAYPTKEKWFLNYETLDAIFKMIEEPVYQRMSAHVNQKAIRKATEAWKAYFKSLKAYRENPDSFLGKPGIPGYIRSKKTTAVWTNQVAKYKTEGGKAYIQFCNCKEKLLIGSEEQFSGMKYVKTEVKPSGSEYVVLITFDDKVTVPEAPKHPIRILGLDAGVNNFLAVCNNFGEAPFLMKGGALKAANQWFNKRRGQLMSKLTAGSDSKYSRKESKNLNALSKQREDFIRDYFYKCAWYLCRYAILHKVEAIVVGCNKNQKQEISFCAANNQNFVSIPYDKFRNILVHVAARCGLPVVFQEESYTSKASLVDGDMLPVYGEIQEEPVFSGIRVKRGLYRTRDGKMLNADINGAGNIIRKAYPYAFEGQELSYLWKTTNVINFADFYRFRKTKSKKKKIHRPGVSSRLNHAKRDQRKTELQQAFGATKEKYVQKAS